MPAEALRRRVGRIAVLLVEDSPDDAELTIGGLRAGGLDVVVTVVDNETAFVAALADAPDVIISDLELPAFDGRRALALRAQLAPETPFIVVSGAVTDEQAGDLIARGATDYLLKDRRGRLVSAVLHSVDAHRTLKARRVAEQATENLAIRWETLTSGSADILAVIDKDLRLVYANDALVRLLGHELHDVIGRNVFDYVHPDDVDAAAEAVGEALTRDGVGVQVIVRLATATGDYRYLETIGNNRFNDPNIGGLVVNGRDVTDRILAERLLAQEAKVLERIASGESPDLVFEMIADIVENSPEPCRAAFDFATEYFTYRLERQPASDDLAERYALGDDGAPIGHMTLWRRPDRAGTPYSPTHVDTARRLATVAAQSQMASAQVVHQALHDPLTGWGNRTLFVQQLDAVLSQAPMATVLMIDIDRLKWINEGLSHEHGDHVIVTFAKRFAACMTEGDILARVGGDEFAVLTGRTPAGRNPALLAKEMLDRAREPVDFAGNRFSTSVSIGIASHDDAGSAGELLGNAEAAVETAKRTGRDRAVLADPESRAEAEERLAVERDLRSGIDRGELVCHLQPSVDLATGTLRGAEALVRWQHPTRGFLGPGQFLPIASQSKLIEAVDSWMLDAACASVTVLGAPPGFTISVNATVRDLVSDGFAEAVLATLDRHQLPTAALALEVTESDAMSDLKAVRTNLLTLHRAGVEIHLDDFGTGYSSLSYLHQLPIDALKIDQSFVQAMVDEPDRCALVEAITALARALRLTTIAEGVETHAQADLLTSMGVDYAQGYLYCKPCSVEDLGQWIAQRQAPTSMMTSPVGVGTIVRNRQRMITSAPVTVDPDASASRVAAGRALLRVETVEAAVGVCISLIRDLGGSTIPARLDDGTALPIDCSFGHGEPLLPIAEPGLARLRLERMLPEVLDDARAAIARIRRHDDVDRQANTDPLTGLLNRRAIDPILRASKPDDVLVVFDLDDFKAVNDTHGHHAGDDVLIAFSRALRDRSRAGDHFARLGGDEVLAVLTATTAEGLDTFARRLHATWTLNRPHDITYSAGAAWIRDRQPLDALAAADTALYAAKHAGRDRMVIDAGDPPTALQPLEGNHD